MDYKTFTVPAVCTTCSSVFPGFSVALGAAATLSLEGNTAGPCPVCGGMGNVIDGTFSLVGDTIRRLTDGLSVSDILRLRTVVENARTNDLDAISISDQIAEMPELASYAEWLKNYFTPKSGADLVGYLGFLLSVITLITPLLQSAPTPERKPLSEEQVVDLTVKAVEDSFAKAQQKAVLQNRVHPAVRKSPKLGRNDPCHCGSGKKHKRCCI